MKTLLLTIVLALQLSIACSQGGSPYVTVDNYGPCDTCFTFTAHPDTFTTGPYTYQWHIVINGIPENHSGQILNFCIHQPLVPNGDSLYLTVTDGNANQEFYWNTLTGLLPNLGFNTTVQNICIVTIDTAINKNLIVWQQTADTAVVSYNIYKETSTSGVYSLLTNVPRTAFSIYADLSSLPDVKSARYRMTTLNNCGGESQGGSSHKTMHLTVSSGTPPSWNLVWENYDGISFLKYRIWRKDINSGWQLIDSVSSSSTTYTDLTPPTGLLHYMIEILTQLSCNPSLKDINTAYSSSFSNVADNGLSGIDENNTSLTANIFPNPFISFTTLQSDKILKNAALVIYNAYGQKVKQIKNIAGQTIVLQRDDLPDGIYFFKLTQENKSFTTGKLVIEGH